MHRRRVPIGVTARRVLMYCRLDERRRRHGAEVSSLGKTAPPASLAHVVRMTRWSHVTRINV